MVVFMNCIYAGILFCGLDYMFNFICWLALTRAEANAGLLFVVIVFKV